MWAAALNQSTLDPSIAGTVLQELMRGSRKSAQNGLTEREMEVLRQLAQGKTNKEIADMLVVSEETIKTHVGNILTKLQLAHRMQAVLYALKQGLISLGYSMLRVSLRTVLLRATSVYYWHWPI